MIEKEKEKGEALEKGNQQEEHANTNTGEEASKEKTSASGKYSWQPTSIGVMASEGLGQKRKKSPKKIIITLVIIAVVIAGAGIAIPKLLPSGGAIGTLVSAGTVERMDLQRIVNVMGIIEGTDSADVYSTSNYRITSILVEEGDKVKKGQVLATLDASDLQTQYSVSKIDADRAAKDYETAKLLFAEGAIPQKDVDAAKDRYDTARYNLSSYNLSEKANVTSPIDGTITRINCTVGRIAGDTTDKQAMFVIEDIDNLQMKVKIGEYDISDISIGQTAEITTQMLGDKTITGVVSKISPTGESSGDGKNMVIPVTIDVDKGDTNLIAGVSAKAKILTASREQVLTVPIDAILEDPETGETSIFTINERTLKKVPVTVGLESDFSVEIKEELEVGTKVLLSPTFEHYDGMQVMLEEDLMPKGTTSAGVTEQQDSEQSQSDDSEQSNESEQGSNAEQSGESDS